MRLIKATTENPLGIFNNTFNSTITIKPNSKICLSSLTTEEAIEGLTIDSVNDAVRVQLTNNNVKTINLTHAVYSDLQFNLFFQDFTRKLNATLASNGKPLGYEYKVDLDNQKRVAILGKQSAYKQYNTSWIKNNTEVNVVNSNGIFNSASTDPTDKNTTNINLEQSFCNGGAIFSCRIHTLVDEALATESGFIIGLTEVSPTQNPKYDEGIIKHGISVDVVGGKYSYFHRGTKTGTDVDVDYQSAGSKDNDVLVVSLNANFYEYKIYNATNPNGILLHTEGLFPRTTDDYKPLYPFISFHAGKNNAKVDAVRYTASPFNDTTLNLFGVDELVEPTLSALPNQGGQPATPQFIEFLNVALANYLGFENQRNPLTLPIPVVKELTLTADDLFVPTSFTDAFTLELLNLSVDSYSFNGEIGERRNILAVINQSYNIQNQIVYNASNLLYIDLLNAYPIDLRELKMRMIRADGTPLRIKGVATAVILIKEQGE